MSRRCAFRCSCFTHRRTDKKIEYGPNSLHRRSQYPGPRSTVAAPRECVPSKPSRLENTAAGIGTSAKFNQKPARPWNFEPKPRRIKIAIARADRGEGTTNYEYSMPRCIGGKNNTVVHHLGGSANIKRDQKREPRADA